VCPRVCVCIFVLIERGREGRAASLVLWFV